ncbi:type II toxin-antitoxin system VapC family toxin [soil metagenome]
MILDTNVVSEFMHASPDPRVVAWMDLQPHTFITSITVAELVHGVTRMPEGERKSHIADAIDVVVETDFVGRVLPFDETAGFEYAHIVVSRKRRGLPMGTMDAMIAAIALSVGSSLATRNTKDFEHLGIPLINPWDQ